MRIDAARAGATALLYLLTGAGFAAAAQPASNTTTLPTISVEAPRDLGLWTAAGSGSRIDGADIARTRPTHAGELFSAVPGTWISQGGSGQEHLTAIRSPVLTGAGACGAFLFLEDGVPIRPAGFCNVNNLFEVNLGQAAAVEVARGPSSSLYGANALHGAINVVSPLPGPDSDRYSIELGQDDSATLRLSHSLADWRFDLQSRESNGFRDHAGFGEQKFSVAHLAGIAGWRVHSRLAATNLNQETAGFIFGKDAYRKAGQRRDNPNPDSYRDASALRLTSVWQRDLDDTTLLSITPYARWSRMAFLQHFLPGQPTEENGQTSAGVILDWRRVLADGGEWRWGAAAEIASGFLKEDQPGPVVGGSPFLVATRPAGEHYDYDVTSRMGALWYALELPLSDQSDSWWLLHSLRAEHLQYDYDNRALTGNSREDGTPCGFGGCLFNRPADRQDHFNNLAGRLGLRRGELPDGQWHGAFTVGFRPPQATELYRLQSGQTTADLDSERLYGIEFGYRRAWNSLDLAAVLFGQRKRNFIFRDANGFNVSDGRTEHFGLETELRWRPAPRHELHLAASLARHRYNFDRAAGGGETIRDGNEVDTAPPFMASARWQTRPVQRLLLELEALRMGPYYLDAANSARYPGHSLLHLRGEWSATPRLLLFARVFNLTNRDYAERADFAFGSFRYFPGQSRRLFLGAEWRP